MKQKYIVLHQSSTKNAGAHEIYQSGGVLANASHKLPLSAKTKNRTILSVEVEELDAAKAKKIQQGKKVLSLTPVMPVKLIRPFDATAAPVATKIAWGIQAVKADQSPFTGAGVKVAVLDTGIDINHSAFATIKKSIIQQDFTGEGVGDKNGHGTHCAGTIFGRNVGGMRIGVCTGLTDSLIGKVLGEKGGGSSEMIIQAMQWAIQQKANVISMSLGIDFPGFVQQMQDEGLPPAIAASRALDAYRANVLLFDSFMQFVTDQSAKKFSQPVIVVAAAGNESLLDENPDYEVAVSPPAVAKGIISVAAVGQKGTKLQIAPFSNSGALVAGPGMNIESAKAGGGLVSFDGTSMATPHVAGVAALWIEKLMNDQADVALKLSGQLQSACITQGLGNIQPHQYGWGLVQAPLA